MTLVLVMSLAALIALFIVLTITVLVAQSRPRRDLRRRRRRAHLLARRLPIVGAVEGHITRSLAARSHGDAPWRTPLALILLTGRATPLAPAGLHDTTE